MNDRAIVPARSVTEAAPKYQARRDTPIRLRDPRDCPPPRSPGATRHRRTGRLLPPAAPPSVRAVCEVVELWEMASEVGDPGPTDDQVAWLIGRGVDTTRSYLGFARAMSLLAITRGAGIRDEPQGGRGGCTWC